jgi:hypothetical protein
MSHKHFCDIGGHEWECDKATCVCVCGTSINQGDHSHCPIELVGCPEHVAEQQRTEHKTERTLADCKFDAKCKRADEMPDGPERDALLREIVESIFPRTDDGGKR